MADSGSSDDSDDDYVPDEDDENSEEEPDPGTVEKDEIAENEEIEEEEEKPVIPEKEKSRVDDLWASFLKDVKGGPPKSKPATETKTVKVMRTFDFAGETITTTEEISAEKAREEEKKKQEEATAQKETPPLGIAAKAASLKRPAGLGSVLDKINKKPKINVLDKSKLDWNQFKEKEGIEDELTMHNRSKNSFIDRKAFLERSDYRQFEIEKEMREQVRKKQQAPSKPSGL